MVAAAKAKSGECVPSHFNLFLQRHRKYLLEFFVRQLKDTPQIELTLDEATEGMS